MRSDINFKVRTLLVLLGQVINKHLRINTSINLESLTEMSQHWAGKTPTREKNRYLDKLTVLKHLN